MLGDKGTKECPPGFSLVTDQVECEFAASALGFIFNADLGTCRAKACRGEPKVCNYCPGCTMGANEPSGGRVRFSRKHGIEAHMICGDGN